ncbi:unnamed protein product [Adineta steineri]|uniref:EGF-like domain-containing protein n=1 Tax=Adineta steineri TaxID=433720 RepID=A0A815TLK7_9BILA|nr:unnamed protein product [Adineta steineri]CAF4115052.1 unnamed protein product [Adineta steineri]
MKHVQSLTATTLGGDADFDSLSAWAKTVPSNPVVTEFSLRDIFFLFTQRNFPNDSLIANKSQLIKNTLNDYLSDSAYCYGSCGNADNTHGICIPSGHFQFGICECDSGWTGPDCMTPVETHNVVLSGTICGFDRSFIRVNCDGQRPWEGCPEGWQQKFWTGDQDLTVCYKTTTSAMTKLMVGTICGLRTAQNYPYSYSHDIACNGTSIAQNSECPQDYRHDYAGKKLRPGLTPPGYYNLISGVCSSLHAKEDLPGTLCGMQIHMTKDGPACDGYNPGLQQCPPNYTLRYTAFGAWGFCVCVKN